MKRSLALCLAVALFSGFAYGQLNKRFMFGGNASFYKQVNNVWTDKESEIQFAMNTSFGLKLNSRIALGLELGYAYSERKMYSYSLESSEIVVGLFLRAHKNITEKFMCYVEPYCRKSFLSGDGITHTPNIYSVGINSGLLFFITPKLNIEIKVASLNYLHEENDDYHTNLNTIFMEYDIVTPNIGLKYYF